jgi:hypothetical protein
MTTHSTLEAREAKPKHDFTADQSMDLLIEITSFTRSREGYLHGRPEDCYPYESAECEIIVWLDGGPNGYHDITHLMDPSDYDLLVEQAIEYMEESNA